jgi:OOP family OmpA-OmpF porin
MGVNFELNSDSLRPEAIPVLDEVVETLRRNPDLIVEIAGYTDSSGQEVSNSVLSQKRAEAVAGYLVVRGIPSSNLKPKGYGTQNPISDNSAPEGMAKNRRVELHILNQ